MAKPFPVAAVATALLLASTWWVLARMVRSGMGLMAAWMGGGYLARISLLALVLLGGVGLDTYGVREVVGQGAALNGAGGVLVGLGDVGGTLLLALKLLGRELGELRIYDPNAAQCRRYELELNQVLPLDHPLPPVTVCTEDTLFDCDLLLFTASRGVPPVGSGVADVRLAQYEKNRAMLRSYAAMARKTHFTGLFCQISDPVDPLACAVFRESNRNAAGEFDGCGLLPEQVQGFGLGVMEARARWCAQEDGIDFSNGRVYGPHGGGLVAANDPAAYDEAVSARLTERTVHANLEVRALGFKPYLAPALSSAAVSILSLVRGQPYYAALPLGGVWLGAQRRMTPLGPLQRREPLHPALLARIEAARLELEAFCHDA